MRPPAESSGQPEALEIYPSAGYRERGPFGPYRDDPLTLFLERDLTL
jgi:putative acetyltransferase